ncbi:MAG: DNA-processing protein DprA, partial [Nitrospiraceae bacterium]
TRARKIVKFNRWKEIEHEMAGAARRGIKLISLEDSSYPSLLRMVPDAPLILYMKGEFHDSDRCAVAMVGSRGASAYGIQMAEKISSTLAQRGITVVSGMARGIDTACHRASLRAGGRTIAVLGCGMDTTYPPENGTLKESIASLGAVISEFPIGTMPKREHFPRRNRIISALSLGVIVVEATLDSGSLITVGYALDQNREVFAVPGNSTSRNSWGTNDLIKKGARLVESADEVIEELGPQLKGILKEEKIKDTKTLPDMTDEERVLFNHLGSEPRHIDTIIRGMEMTMPRALSVLLSLELKGVVRQSEGKQFAIS